MLNRLHKSRELFDRLFCYIWQGRGNNGNSYLLTGVLRGERPHVLIDPGFIMNEMREYCFESLEKTMEADGFKMEDIGLVINTHTHPDHCQATETVVQRSARKQTRGKISQAVVALSREEYDYYRLVGDRMFGMFGQKAPRLDPFIYLAEGDLVLGRDEQRANLQVFLTAGHSPGSICLYWVEKKALITGDLLFFGGVGRTDFPGGSITTLKHSIDRLSSLDVEYVLPGHSTEYGSIIEGKDKVERNFMAVKLII
jgi:hydroxyacylglutathione hydrolase